VCVEQQYRCHVLLPGEHSDGMEDEDDYEAGVNFSRRRMATAAFLPFGPKQLFNTTCCAML
jgi:hypothetical protein